MRNTQGFPPDPIFGAQNSLLWYATHQDIRYQPPPLWYGTDHSVLKKAITETQQKKDKSCDLSFFSSGGWTRTNDLRVMSPTSYQLLYPAMFGNTKVGISFEFTKFFSLLLQILRSAARFLPVPRLFSAAEELSH